MQPVLILHNIRSTHNVGAIFRTADAAGVGKVYLIGITPTPIDKYGRARKDVAKAALGAELTMPWEYKKTLVPVLKSLKKEGHTIIAIEQSPKSVDYKKVKPKGSVAFIVGNEVDGLPKKILEAANVVAEIPMQGTKESLNVSVATGIALFRILDR